MNNLILLIKISTAMFQAWRLKDKELMDELIKLTEELPKSKESLVVSDKKVENKLKALIEWIKKQPAESSVITSLLNTKVGEIVILSPELENVLNNSFNNELTPENSRELIFQIIKELRNTQEESKFNLKFKTMVRPFLFEGEEDLTKDDWLKINELISSKIESLDDNEFDKAVVEASSSNDPLSIKKIVDQLKIETSPEGIMKTGLAGLNKALYPDCGLRRGLTYLINGLTNRGKSLGLAHLLSSVPLYNKPVLRDKSKIPTVVLMSAEDSLGVIFKRMFELFSIAKTGVKPSFFESSSDEVVKCIIDTFSENGWSFQFFRVNPSHDNIKEIQQRIRKLELKGHEVIFAAYDYLAMADLAGCSGDSKSDKLQDLFRRFKNFFGSRGAINITPHQLNPDAKKHIRELDDDSEIYFAKYVGGKSMTDGSTKLTNEVDVEITFHVAKLSNNECYFTYYVGKQRAEGSQESDRFGIYPLHPELGLVHDVNLPKSTYRKSLTHKSEANGGGADFDDLEMAA